MLAERHHRILAGSMTVTVLARAQYLLSLLETIIYTSAIACGQIMFWIQIWRKVMAIGFKGALL